MIKKIREALFLLGMFLAFPFVMIYIFIQWMRHAKDIKDSD